MIKRSLITVLLSSLSLYAATFEVFNTSDNGTGSLRNALQNAQTHAGPDTIFFTIPPNDPGNNKKFCTIAVESALPELTDDGNFIDGFSQASSLDNTPAIMILGKESIVYPGIVILSAFNTVRGIAFCRFGASGIQIRGESAHNNLIQGCYSGLSADGITRLENSGSGLEIMGSSHHNSIGGHGDRYRNIFSGNGNYGIRVELSHHNTFLNNWAGLDKTGLHSVPNGQVWRQQTAAGLFLGLGSYSNLVGDGSVGGRNIFSGNNRTGLRIEWTGADSNVVRGNYFGVGIDGATIIPNAEAGIVIGRGASFNTIGGDSITDANVISGNYSSGIQFARKSRYNVFKGNIIGLSADLKKVAPNKHNGIYFYGDEQEGYPQYNTVGPDNIICSNGVENYNEWGWAGLSLNYSGTSHNHFWGNYIGLTPDSTLISGQPTGILVQGGAHNNIFGPDNMITASLFNGVLIMGNETLGNTLTRNVIFANKEKLLENFNGGNRELDPPKILTVEPNFVKGTADPGSRVEIYRGNSFGILSFIDSVLVDSLGFFSLHGNIPLDFQVLALAIDQDGNTSEFSSSEPLPVELMNFKVSTVSQNRVRLTWVTGVEKVNYGFYVERSADEQVWQQIGFIPAQPADNGNHYYQLQDSVTVPGTWYYRLVQVDLDGTTNTYPSQSVYVEYSKDLELFIYPSPFITFTHVDVRGNERNVKLFVYNMQGQRVKTLWRGNVSGDVNIRWEGDDDHGNPLASGIYYIMAQSLNCRVSRSVIRIK